MKPIHVSTTSAVTLILAMPAAADVIYSNLKDISIPANFAGVYLDVDTGNWNTNALAPQTGWDINPFFGGSVLWNSPGFQAVRSGTGETDAVLNLGEDTIVGSGSVFSTFVQGPGGENPGGPGYGSSEAHLGNGAGQFGDGTEGYLGFRLNGNYGWMRVVLTNNGSGALIKEWAYDNSGAQIATANIKRVGSTVTLDSTLGAFSVASAITDSLGATNLLKTGIGITTLAGTNTYTGTTTVNAGTLSISSDGNLGTAPLAPTAGSIVLDGGTLRNTAAITIDDNRGMSLGAAGGTLNNAANGTTTYQGIIAGTSGGSLTVTHGGSTTGDLSLGADNTYDGATIIDNGHLSATNLTVGASSSIGSSGNAASNLVLKNNAILHYLGGGSPATTDRLFTLGLGDNEIRSSGAGGVTFSNTGAIAYTGSGNRTLSLNGTNASAVNTLAAVVGDGSGGATSLNKLGSGTWALTGTNTYTGTTTVSGGTLLVNGSHTGGGTVTVDAAATLGGTGSIAGALNVTGVLTPGGSVDTFSSGALTMNAGSTFVFEATGNGASGADLMTVNGALSLTDVSLDLLGADLGLNIWTLGDKLTLISYTGTGITAGFTGYDDDTTYAFGGNEWLFDYNDAMAGGNFNSQATGTSFVTLTAVPEPSAALLGGLGMMLLLRRRRR